MKKGKILEIRGEIKDTNSEKMQEWKAYISVEEEHNKLVYKYCSMDSNSNFTNITFRDDYLLLVNP